MKSKRDMNKIKSKMAECYILNHSAHRDSKEGKEMGVVTTYVDAKEAIILAEQEAEQRAKVAFKHTLKHLDMTYIQRGAIGLVFEELLNNGGHSDE